MTAKNNEKIDEILAKVAQHVEPTREEVDIARKAEKKLRERLDRLGVEYLFVGSYARNTWLKGNLEIDVFILFPEEISENELERRGLQIGKTVLDSCEVRYAEHPYVHGVVAGVEADIVPCYKLKSPEKIKSAVDRTPFHHEWLKDRVKGRERDIRILKALLKANNLYGAEYKVRGFSGYLCELLVIFYGSFKELVKNATCWTRRTVIDVKNNEVRRGDTFFVVDPVDERRNVAANLSLDNLAIFVHLCREFLENPSIEFFMKRRTEIPPDDDILNEVKSRVVFAIEFPRPDIIEDNLYPQLERACRKINEFLGRANFMPLRSSFHAGKKCYLLFECQVPELSRIERRLGPPFEEKEHVKKFLKRKRFYKSFIEEGRWWAYEFRKHIRPEEAVKKYIAERWRTLGKNVGEVLREGFRILKGEDLLVDELKEKLVEFLTMEVKK